MVDGNKITFSRAFWAFGVSIDGSQYCRLINIDSTHFYGRYKEKLMVAIAYDVNNIVYLLCFAIVE